MPIWDVVEHIFDDIAMKVSEQGHHIVVSNLPLLIRGCNFHVVYCSWEHHYPVLLKGGGGVRNREEGGRSNNCGSADQRFIPSAPKQEPTETSKPPIKTRYLGHVTGY
eukprot:sb/3477568/